MDLENELTEISGTVESVIYKNEENGYTVLRLNDQAGAMITVVGCFPYASPGESMIVTGSWMNHAVHGRQFKAEFAQRLLPTTASAIYDYLAGGSVRGVGPATASLIVNEFGEKTLEVMENSPQLLAKIRGISAAKAEQISKSFRRQAGVRRLMEFVCSFGLRPILAMRMYKFYGDDALALLRDNPYILATEHIGGSFAEADTMALEMGVDSYSKNRICAAVLFELVHNSGNGHCFIPREKLAAVTAQLIGVDEPSADECIDILIESGQLMHEEIAGCKACYLPSLYHAESDAAEHIARMCKRRFDETVNIPALISTLEKQLGIQYAPLQRKTLKLALENQIIVITGGPGTGKTTSIRAILAMFDRLGLKTLLTAPTGRAAKRMTELTGQESSTVHRLLEAKFSDDGETVVFGKNESDRLDCDAVILDECSMVDIVLMDALLSALPPDARLVMVGDADQLPSVGPGNVFSAVIRSQVVPTIRLTEIFRQNEGSRIVRNAHMINKGEHPNLSENAGDFFRLKRLEAGSTVDTIAELCSVRLPGKMGIPPEDIQVLSPTRRGELGTVSLNKRLQQVLNPPRKDKKEKAFGDVVFREGDRVMQIKNNYDILWQNESRTAAGSGIYNGDIGTILSIDMDSESLSVNFDGRIASYGFDSLIELEHAWAMTVHKSQGSEYRAVILSLSPGSQMLLTRDVLYTAVTRAKELLIMVGDDATAYKMIDNFRQSKRYSALRVRLRKLCGVEQ
ncbi:MAG: ATP-dependent RecD-like DNA helicase [Candidatus Limivicinus sp.]|nr:ATP-dependent RecD-like DNA helicase [Clostridiales bacterium]MDY6133106.1 ATP-dependent RecD-like DNA helicase [Candidatus Limivicinus sp.]